jgi:hypothetical protein
VLKYIQFYPLPPQARISSPARLSALFGLDVMIWGSYAGEDGKLVWANIYRRLSKVDRREHKERQEKDDEFGLRHQNSLFPSLLRTFEIDVPAMSFTQENLQEVYILILVAVISALQTRQLSISDDFFGAWDKLRLSASKAINNLMTHLAFESFSVLPEEPIPDTFLPSASSQLTELIGKWIGHQLASSLYKGQDDLWKRFPEEQFTRQLRSLADKCTRIQPARSEHFYRLGAIYCLLKDKPAALRAFRQASKLDASGSHMDHVGAGVMADMALSDADRDSADEEHAFGRFAAHAACALGSGETSARNSIAEKMAQSIAVQLTEHAPERNQVSATAIAVVRELLGHLPAANTK